MTNILFRAISGALLSTEGAAVITGPVGGGEAVPRRAAGMARLGWPLRREDEAQPHPSGPAPRPLRAGRSEAARLSTFETQPKAAPHDDELKSGSKWAEDASLQASQEPRRKNRLDSDKVESRGTPGSRLPD